jgi:hypothetical protein
MDSFQLEAVLNKVNGQCHTNMQDISMILMLRNEEFFFVTYSVFWKEKNCLFIDFVDVNSIFVCLHHTDNAVYVSDVHAAFIFSVTAEHILTLKMGTAYTS